MHQEPVSTKGTIVAPPLPDHGSRLHDITMAMMGCRQLDELFDRILEATLSLTRADTVLILLAHETGEHLECVAAGGEQQAGFLGVHRLRGQGLAGSTWAGGEPRFIEDVNAEGSHGRWRGHAHAYLHPLRHGEHCHGVLAAYASDAGDALRDDVGTLARIGELAGVAIHNVRSAEWADTSLQRTHVLGEVSRQLFELDDATSACNIACRMLLSVVDVMRASTFLVDAHGVLQPHVCWQTGDAGIVPGRLVAAELLPFSLAQAAFDRSAPVSVTREEATVIHDAPLDAVLQEHGIGSSMALPLLRGGRPTGSVVISRHRSRRDLNEAEIDVYRVVINQLSTALERSELARQLEDHACSDRLTGLPDRSRFEGCLTARLAACLADERASGAVLFIDLDRFSRINGTFGHTIGDALLGQVADRLRSVVQRSDLLARMGGDQFAILLRGTAGAPCLAERALEALHRTFEIDEERIDIRASIGLCRFPQDGGSIDTLLRHADVAMRNAKHAPGGGPVHFTAELMRAANARETLESALQAALEENQFELVYQPQLGCRSGRVEGVEALIRWRHPLRGLLPPGEFIPVAEASGLIDRIGRWVIETAAARLAAWQGTPLAGRRLSINIAASQFQQADFVDSVLDALARHRAPAAQLELEVTETVVMQDIAHVAERLQRLRAAGLRIAIDDFGTGYSSLSYLQDLPLDVLKIDRAFVTRLSEHGRNEHTLVNTIVLLCQGLGLQSVAEGVETQSQADTLERLGCDLVQGYLHAAPVFEKDLVKAVRRMERRAARKRKRAAVRQGTCTTRL